MIISHVWLSDRDGSIRIVIKVAKAINCDYQELISIVSQVLFNELIIVLPNSS